MAINVSCIIPCFNDAKNLPMAVESCLMQGDNVEVIIVDDASTDTSFRTAQEIAAKSAGRVRAFRNAQNSGPAFTRNHGVLYARGALLCFLDSDDQYLAGFVQRCASLLAQQPDSAAVKTLIEVVDLDGTDRLDKSDPRLAAAAGSYPCNMVVRKEIFLALGGFPVDARYRGPLGGEDDAFFRTLTGLFRCHQIPQALVRHHNRTGSHLESFLARTRVENGKIVFVENDDPAFKAQEVLAATRDYFLQAQQNLSSLARCSLAKTPGHLPSPPAMRTAANAAAAEGEPRISFVTTCKGRLHHLRQTLPLLAALENAEVIVVDYACPDDTAAWVEAHHPNVRVVRITDDPGFLVSRARNAGANAATSPWLCFIDADVAIKDGLLPWATEHLCADAYYRPQPYDAEAYGTFFCTSDAFHKAGGYDEAIHGWGGEDDDLYLRLALAGYREDSYPSSQVAPIRHGDDERTTFYEVKNRAVSHRIYQWYSIMKFDLMAIRKATPALDERRMLMKLARDAALRIEQTQGMENTELLLNLGERMDMMRYTGCEVQRTLVYRHVLREPHSLQG